MQSGIDAVDDALWVECGVFGALAPGSAELL